MALEYFKSLISEPDSNSEQARTFHLPPSSSVLKQVHLYPVVPDHSRKDQQMLPRGQPPGVQMWQEGDYPDLLSTQASAGCDQGKIVSVEFEKESCQWVSCKSFVPAD